MRFLIYLVLLLSFVSTGYAANQSGDPIILDAEGWCPTLPVEFRVYNESEFSIRDDIEEDEDRNFSLIASASVTIHNGPLESLPVLSELTTDANGSFEVTFPKENDYFTSIVPKGNYSRLETFIEIESCSRGLGTGDESSSTNNKSFTYLQGAFTVNLTNTQLNESDISIQELTENSALQKSSEFPETYLTAFEISGINSENSSSVSLRYDFGEEDNYKTLYYYNTSNETWQLQSASLNDGILIITTNISGIYLLTQEDISLEETENVSVEVVSSTETGDETSNTSVSLDSEENLNSNAEISEESLSVSTQEESTSFTLYWTLGGVLLLLLAGGGFFFMHKNKEHADLSHELKEKSEQSKKSESLGTQEESQLLTSYQQIYEHTKNYVNQYKEQYSKDQLFRALKDANVSEDVINKVFEEVYK